MARATRSSTTHEKDKPQDEIPHSSRKGASKKRKRTSNADSGDSPPAKHTRADIKEEGTSGLEGSLGDGKPVELPSSGDVPLSTADAASILDVLEIVDTQGLLDRVFPLPIGPAEVAPSAESSSSSSMLSLRTLLKDPAQHPFRLLRVAIKHLYPISSHPRFRPSETAAQQRRFCDLASSLLDQASRNVAPIPMNTESLIPDAEMQDEAASPTTTRSRSPVVGVQPRKFALVQHLPTGDWWTSVSSGIPTTQEGEKDVKSLYTAKADLVSIFPSTSGSELAHKGTLGDYVAKRPLGVAPSKPPPPRRVTCGKFLDYGPYASFAPSFDQDGVEIGRVGMGEVIFHQEMRRRLRSLAKGKRRAFQNTTERATDDVSMEVSMEVCAIDTSATAGPSTDLSKGLASLLPEDAVCAIKAAVDTLEMEQAVEELLQRNAKALQRLDGLQRDRLRAQGGGSSVVEVGSEEWDVAQGILDSLVALASLRPRPSNGSPDHAPFVPPSSVLHALQRTLPLAATEGWYGTLPEKHTTAFRDDTTVHARAGSVVDVKAVATTPSTPAPKDITPTPAYTPYSYPGAYQSSQYRGYGAYPSSQGYYPNSNYTASTPQQSTTPQYSSPQFNAATGQYYGSWYGSSGRSTPQPTTGTAGMSGNYASYFASGAAQSVPQRAVANTVAKPAYPQATWNSATGGYAAPTLPPHMRSAVGGTSATPPPTTPPATGYGGYYGGYTAPQ